MKFYALQRYIFITVALVTLLMPFAARADEAADSIPTASVSADSIKHRRNIFQKFFDYFANSNKTEITTHPRFSLIGGPSYSVDTKFSIGLLAAGLYSTDPTDTSLMHSNISLTGQVSTAGYYMLGARGTHVFPHDTRRINYRTRIYSFSTYFWGIGFDDEHINANRSAYDHVNFMLSADYSWQIAPKFFLGPMIYFDYTYAHKVSDLSLWEHEPLSAISAGLGMALRLDTRDNINSAYSGVLLELSERIFPSIFGRHSRNFALTEANFNVYKTVWKGGVVAGHIHGEFTIGESLWNMMPVLGGSMGFRGYYDGRYRDRNEIDAIIELRQHFWIRSGVAIWGGIGSVFHHFDDMRWKKLLPNVGIGYRWEFKQRTCVRLDYGIGRGESGLVFQINEAF
ncbi:MAG: hypothetical protein NC098_09225 [Lachnoclostridium sp.]|nr:hypothetical protein [Lachnoclostridium sp.]